MKLSRILSQLVLATTLIGAPLVAAAAPVPATPTSESTPARAPSATPASDAARYAEREQQTPAAASFEGGGQGVYIGGSVVTVLLVLLLIVIIL